MSSTLSVLGSLLQMHMAFLPFLGKGALRVGPASCWNESSGCLCLDPFGPTLPGYRAPGEGRESWLLALLCDSSKQQRTHFQKRELCSGVQTCSFGKEQE